MSQEPKLNIAFTGGRFDSGQIPTDFLPDITALGNALNGAVKQQYLAQTGRSRVPSRFAEQTSAAISDITKGSLKITISPLQSTPPPGQTLPLLPSDQSYIAQGWELVVLELAMTSEHNGHRPAWARPLRRFGLHLVDGETAHLSTNGRTVMYDRETRRRYLTQRFPNEQYSEWSTIHGYVHSRDLDADNFGITTGNQQRLTAPITDAIINEIDRAFTLRMNGVNATIELIGEISYTAPEHPIRVDSVSDVSVNHPLDISQQIQRLSDLEDGWHNGAGTVITPDHLIELAELFERRLRLTDATMPRLFPTPEGCIQAEWQIGDTTADLEIDFANNTATWGSTAIATGETEERQLDPKSDDDCQWLNSQLNQLAAEAQ